VFTILLKNAMEAIGDRPGILTVRTRTAGSEVVVEIADSGRGIAEKDLSCIFDPFFTTKAIGSGTGLGLSRAYGIVQAHQGRIEVASDPGVGSVLRVVLPLKLRSEALPYAMG
jgi:two-component system, NtrC family, sensor kinase